MRAAAIFGLGSSPRDLKPFQRNLTAKWRIGMPAAHSDADAILIFGGDGTVHRHLSQIAKLHLPVLVVPAGSGNDFARALGVFNVRDSVVAWQKFVENRGNVRAIDLGVITPLRPDGSTGVVSEESVPNDCSRYSAPVAQHYFCCVAGCGLDAEIACRANRLPRWLRSHGGYAFSLLPALLRFAPPRMKLSLPCASPAGEFDMHSDQPAMLVAFANAGTYGDGMRIAPKAELGDGKLDVCVIRTMEKIRLMRLFPSVYFGRHLRIPEVEYFQAERLRLETESPLDLYADGEYACQTPIEVGVMPKALRVVVP